MAQGLVVEVVAPQAPVDLPEWAREPAALLASEAGQKVIREMERRLHIRRQGGYAGVDGFVTLLVLFASGLVPSIKDFDEQLSKPAGLRQALAALAGRKTLPSSSALSRLLSDVQLDEVRAVSGWLLGEGSGVVELAKHSLATVRDTTGADWQVFDFDPTRTVLSQRAPDSEPDIDGDEMPPSRRRSTDIAKPGYTGHKRGNVVVHRATLQHAGLGLWLAARITAGGGERREDLAAMLQAVVHFCALIDHPMERTVLRTDGEYGSVPSFTACRAIGLRLITRLSRYALLDQADVRQRLAEGSWMRVPSSGSGPARSALDLGLVLLPASPETVQADGSAFEPIEVRVIVSRYTQTVPHTDDHGRWIDGWRYELFIALDLDPVAWPPAEVVSHIFARSSIECRFAQEDRELGLDHIFSYNLAGQELASVVGLLVWNLWTLLGWRLSSLPDTVNIPPLSPLRRDTRPAPVFEAETAPTEPDPADEPSLSTAAPVPEPPRPIEPAERVHQIEGHIGEFLQGTDTSRWMERHPGWGLDWPHAAVQCPAGKRLHITIVKSTHSQVSFRPPSGTCAGCPLRDTCLGSANPTQVKVVTIAIPAEVAGAIEPLMGELHLARRHSRSAAQRSRPTPSGRPRRRGRGQPFRLRPATDPAEGPGTDRVGRHLVDMAMIRRTFHIQVRSVSFRVDILLPKEEPLHPAIRPTPGKRRHQRCSWEEHARRYALPPGSRLEIRASGGAGLFGPLGWRVAETGPPG